MNKLEHGMYCEVTREQAVELLTIEGQVQHAWQYVEPFFTPQNTPIVWFDSQEGLLLSGLTHGNMYQRIPFSDFKQRLVNTVKNGIK